MICVRMSFVNNLNDLISSASTDARSTVDEIAVSNRSAFECSNSSMKVCHVQFYQIEAHEKRTNERTRERERERRSRTGSSCHSVSSARI